MLHRAIRGFLFVVVATVGCSSSTNQNNGAGSGGAAGSGGSGGSGGAPVVTSPVCDALGLPTRAFSDGPTGMYRREIAADFKLDLINEEPWQFKTQWSGCENVLFIPDTLVVSALDSTSIWDNDLNLLLKKSPPNTQYFFVSRAQTDEAAKTALDAMRARIDAALAAPVGFDPVAWKPRLHVVATRAGAIDGWVKDVLAGHGRGGFAIDRQQKVRGVGSFADVARFDSALEQAMQWPWKANLAYAAYDAAFLNFDAEQQIRLDADGATVVSLWKGETLEEFAETDVMLPSAAEMAKFDTLEIDVEQGCPDPKAPEFGNCGAWDYLASLGVRNDAMENIEIARFITSYHRESHWVVDVSPMLVLLQKGGMQHFRWDFAPSWNKQPTATKLSLRLSNQNKGLRPVRATFLWSGGDFNAMYNMSHAPKTVPIAAATKKAEIWALITGHGAAMSQCAEFCNHRHEFTVDGQVFLKEHKEAGSSNKCVPEAEKGMVPNQGGTWWFGRGGWCPGQKVHPWTADITTTVKPGMDAMVSYRGLFGTTDPPDDSGNIVMTSYLVEYE